MGILSFMPEADRDRLKECEECGVMLFPSQMYKSLPGTQETERGEIVDVTLFFCSEKCWNSNKED